MNTEILMKAGFCAVLFAGLLASSGPGEAKVTIACKNPVVTGDTDYKRTRQAAEIQAMHDWSNKVANQYGLYWASFYKAKNPQFTCLKWPHGWRCSVTASPCAQVKPPSSSEFRYPLSDRYAFGLPLEDITMNTEILMKAGFCAVLFAGLLASSGPGEAKVTIACKNPVVTGDTDYKRTRQAAEIQAMHDWSNKVANQYGLYWASFYKAKNPQFTCLKWPHGWRCSVTASPCAQVKPPSSSANLRMVPALQSRISRNQRLQVTQGISKPVRGRYSPPRYRQAGPPFVSGQRRKLISRAQLYRSFTPALPPAPSKRILR